MSAAVRRDRRYTWEEYLAIEAAAGDGERYEYWDGEVRPVHGYHPDGVTAMAGAEPEHNQLKGNLTRELGLQLTPRGCHVFSSDQRVAVYASHRFVYPDVVVACRPEYDESRPRRLLNPDLVVEVLSPSTGDSDAGAKLATYTALPSVQEVWIADPGRPLVIQYLRPDGGGDWRMRATTSLDAGLRSDALGLDLSMGDLYALVLDEPGAE
ncbi:Uma2 family endonuclease [Rubrivirga sp.]|uniref:Uma2 family endonuclease n=1 Tax=Rubrivirga sp. TaxID=1885344 RepID=UPI003B52CCAE